MVAYRVLFNHGDAGHHCSDLRIGYDGWREDLRWVEAEVVVEGVLS